MTRILIIGDPADPHPPVAPLFANGDYAVLSVPTGTSLSPLVEREQPDALLIDARQPDLDGAALLRAWRASSAALRPVVLLATGPVDIDADAVLVSPWEPAELLATVRGLLRAGQRLGELHGRTQELDVLTRLLEAANTAANIQQLAPLALDCMVQAFGAERAGLWLLERAKPVCLAAHGMPAGSVHSHCALPPEHALGRVMASGLPLYGGPGPDSPPAALVPLVDDDNHVLGVIQIDRAAALGRGECTMLELMACHTARAFGRIQRYEHAELQRRRLELIDQKKDEYISLTSHELKNPMASIKGYSDLLLRRVRKTPGDPNLKGLEIISQQVGRMTGLLDQLLDFSRINTNRLKLDLEYVDLVVMLERVVEEWRGATSQHSLCLDLEEPSLITSMDQLRLGQAINNLIGNAIKYSPNGGTITVRMERIDDGAHAEARISVSDQGIGIPESDQAYLFERFFRGSNVDADHSGMGLGLFITRQIVQQHGGQILVESAEGRGTTFSIVLPLAPASIEIMR